jgi:hypothetical protein
MAYLSASLALPTPCRCVSELFTLCALRGFANFSSVSLVMTALAREDFAVLDQVPRGFTVCTSRYAEGLVVTVICGGTICLGSFASELFRVLLRVENVRRRKREHGNEMLVGKD